MCLASFKKTSSAFNTFIQSLPLAWSLPSTLEGGKNRNCAKTLQRPNTAILDILREDLYAFLCASQE
jgi:hypothetical protein